MPALPNKAARAIIDEIRYITIATTDQNGQPWNTPVAAVHDEHYCFYWASWAENQHSKNIRANDKVFIVAYDSNPEGEPGNGVYILGRATEIQDEEEADRVSLLFKDDPYNPLEGKYYLGNYPRRLYKAMPDKIWINKSSEVDDSFVDVLTEAEA